MSLSKKAVLQVAVGRNANATAEAEVCPAVTRGVDEARDEAKDEVRDEVVTVARGARAEVRPGNEAEATAAAVRAVARHQTSRGASGPKLANAGVPAPAQAEAPRESKHYLRQNVSHPF
mmetsp:Transcript_24591/g.46430  ORF Transcript_24591/g.46430 Transcript_24591/m.46430 type:complete len:119 (-) Transcript_24591:52-408(-)